MSGTMHRFSKSMMATLVTLVTLAMPLSPGFAQNVKFAHCLGGCPNGADAGNDLIARPIYTLSFNRETRIADWVAYMVSSDSIGVATNLARDPRPDPYVDDTLEGNMVASGGGGTFELSPFAPLVSFAGTPYWNDTNFLTNMAPRNPELNRGSWYGLEWAVRNLANRSGAIYVLTGPLHAAPRAGQSRGPAGEVKIPTGFYKVVADTEGNVAAFMMDQELPFHVHHCEQLVPLRDVERATGLEFFPQRRDWPAGDLSPRLGCFR